MRVGCWVLALAVLAGSSIASADVYRYRDRSGALVFTNAPVQSAVRLGIKGPPIPPAPRMFGPQNLAQLLAQPIPLPTPSAYDTLIRDVAERHELDYALVKAVIKAESDFDRT